MESKSFRLVFTLILVFSIFSFPVYAERSSSSTQSVSVTVPSTTATSVTYTEDTNSKFIPLLLFGDTTDYRGNLYLTNPSNKNKEIWIKVDGFNTETRNSFKLSGIKYWVQGTDKQGELTDSYTKAGVLNKPKPSNKGPLPALNLQIGMSSRTVPENCTATMYVTTINCDSTVPVN